MGDLEGRIAKLEQHNTPVRSYAEVPKDFATHTGFGSARRNRYQQDLDQDDDIRPRALGLPPAFNVGLPTPTTPMAGVSTLPAPRHLVT